MARSLGHRALLLTTALSAGTILTQPTEAAERLKLGVGGYFHGFGVIANEDDGVGEAAAGRRDHKIAREAEIHFTGDFTLDNGIEVGVDVQLEAETCGDQIDESYIYFQGNFGQLKLGSDDPASYNLYVGPGNPIPGHGLNDPTFRHVAVGGNTVGTPYTRVSISIDAEKITYTTPRWAGLQLGVSYTPDRCEEATAGSVVGCGGSYAGLPSDMTAGQQSEIIEAGVNYMRKVGSFDFAIGAAYAEGDLEVAAVGAEDRTQWGASMRVGFSGLHVGAGFRHDNQGLSGSNTDRTDWTVGADYIVGDWRFGIEYWHGEAEAGAGLGEDEADAIEVGATYALGPGVVLSGGVQYWDLDDNLNAPANENEAWIGLIGATVSF